MTHHYDGEGRRVAKKVGATTTYYFYDAAGQMMAEYGGPAQTAATHYFTTDYLGSTRMILGATGGCVERLDYAPFGGQISRSGYDCYGSASNEKPLYTGQMRDGESTAGTDTGQDYFNARYFWANTARFTSPDAPFADQRPEDGQSWNMYAYVRNNPIKFTDPNGQRCVDGRTVDVGPDEDGNACFDTTVTAEPEKDSEADDPPTGFFYGWLWLHGLLPRSIHYPEGSRGTEDMRRSTVVQSLREKYIRNGCPAYALEYSGHFPPWRESAGNLVFANTTQFEIGGFSMASATSSDRAMTSHTIRNATGWSSLSGLSTWGPPIGFRGDEWDIRRGPGANVEQVFVWTEPNPCQ